MKKVFLIIALAANFTSTNAQTKYGFVHLIDNCPSNFVISNIFEIKSGKLTEKEICNKFIELYKKLSGCTSYYTYDASLFDTYAEADKTRNAVIESDKGYTEPTFKFIKDFNPGSASAAPGNAAQTTCVNTAGTTGSNCVIVYDDASLDKDRYGYLTKGKLGKDYTVEPLSGWTNKQLIIVRKGDLIWFFPQDGYSSTPLPGTLQMCTIRNTPGIGLLTFGYYQGITFPYGTTIYFGRVNGPNNENKQVRVTQAILGADCQIPGVGFLKKGTTISFNADYRDGYTNGVYSINGGPNQPIK